MTKSPLIHKQSSANYNISNSGNSGSNFNNNIIMNNNSSSLNGGFNTINNVISSQQNNKNANNQNDKLRQLRGKNLLDT